jgi:hypothetical protein
VRIAAVDAEDREKRPDPIRHLADRANRRELLEAPREGARGIGVERDARRCADAKRETSA